MLYNYNGGYMIIEFGSLKELYDRITPALISKRTANIEDSNAYVIKKISTEMREPIFDE